MARSLTAAGAETLAAGGSGRTVTRPVASPAPFEST